MILDDFLPRADVSEHHSIVVPAPMSDVYTALNELRLSEISFVVKLLMAIRALPVILCGPRRPRELTAERSLLSNMVADGFVLLADTPQEIVIGLVARPWRLVDPQEVRLRDPKEFLSFDDPTMAKIACNLHMRAVDGGTLLSTETRVQVPDASSLRLFRRYWWIIRHGSALIRVLWLRATARKAVKLRLHAVTQATAPQPRAHVEGGAP